MATRNSQIIDINGEPIQVKLLDEEMSAASTTGIRQVWHSSVANSLGPQRLATILQSAAEGNAYDYLTLAEEMEERDAHYSSVLSTRKLALAGLDIRVDAYSDEQRDIDVADQVRAIVSTPEFGETIFDLCDALGKGYSVTEIIWDRSGKPWLPSRLEHRDPRFFQWDRATGTQLRLLDAQDPSEGIPLPPFKFIVHQPRLRSGLPVRGGLARLAAVGYMCKAWTWRDWMAFADIYGLPMRVGRYGINAQKEDISKLIQAVSNLGSDAAAVLPDSTRIEFEQAANVAGSADFFERLANWWDKQVSKAILGQTMTTDDGSSRSQAEVHNDVRLDLLQADARSLNITLNRDLVRPFVDLNYGPGRYPQLVVHVPQPEDMTVLIDALEKLVPMGLQVEESVMRDKLGLPDPAQGKKVRLLTAPAAPTATVSDPDSVDPIATASNSELAPASSAREDQLADLLARNADPIIGDWVDTIQGLMDSSNTIEEFRDRMLEVLPALDSQRFATAMQHALSVAQVAGMVDALDDSRA